MATACGVIGTILLGAVDVHNYTGDTNPQKNGKANAEQTAETGTKMNVGKFIQDCTVKGLPTQSPIKIADVRKVLDNCLDQAANLPQGTYPKLK